MGYRLVKYEPKHLPAILALQAHLWASDQQINADYFAWKYQQNPYLDRVLIYLALDGDEVVAMRGLTGAAWRFGTAAAPFIAPCAGDTVVEPRHRRKGLVRELFRFIAADEELAGFPYLLNFSAGEAVYFAQQKQGWHIVCNYDAATRSHRLIKQPALRASWSLARRILGKGLRDRLLGVALRRIKRGGEARPAQVVASDRPSPQEMAALVQQLARPGKICHVRDEGYYAWRFRSPLSTYRFYFWRDAGLRGFLVTQQRRLNAAAPVVVADWECADPTVLEDLLRAAIGDTGIGRLVLWTATLPEPFADVLRDLAFENRDAGRNDGGYRPSMMVTGLNESLADDVTVPRGGVFRDINRWDLRMIYSDKF